MNTGIEQRASPPASGLHWPALLVAVAIMFAGTAFPFIMADAQGQADHAMAMALFWSMAAGFVRGVGFEPEFRLWRWLLSGWACAIALALYTTMKWAEWSV